MSLDEAFALLNRTRDLIAGPERDRALLYAGSRAGVKAEEISGEYPEPSGKALALFYDRTDVQGRPFKSKFKSLKQQRKVFGLIKKGKVPTRRSGRLGASMTSQAYLIDRGVAIKVGTNRPGAEFVIGPPDIQSHYHEGTWSPLQQKIEARKAEIIGVFSESLINYIRGYIRGGK